MKSDDVIKEFFDELTRLGFVSTAPNELVLDADAIQWQLAIEPTRLVPNKINAYLGAKEVSDFAEALNSEGKATWFPQGVFVFGRYEQRGELLALNDPVSIETHYCKDDTRQLRHQIGSFQKMFAPLTASVRSLRSYQSLLSEDAAPFKWATDHAVLRIAAIYYLAKRLDRAMPELPPFAEQQFLANSGRLLNAYSLEQYIRFLHLQPL